MVDPVPATPRARLALWAPAALVAAATLAHLAYYSPRVVDDLFISLRFAENLAHGRGAVYNVGERVEGYSGALWMLLQALGYALRVEGVTWTKLLGAACLLATQWGLFRLTRDVMGVRPALAWIPCVALAANSYVVNWATLGLETPLHLAAMVLLPVAVHAWLSAPSPRRRALAVAAIVACGMARPESVLYLAVNAAAPVLAARSRDDAKDVARRLVTGLWPAVAALAAMLLLRRAYYGYWVPNTYFVKGHHVSRDLARLLPLWGHGAGPTERVVYAGGALLLLVFGWTRRALAPGLMVLACLYFITSVILDWMPSLRHHLPVTLLTPVGWAVLADALASKGGRARWLALAPAALVLHAAAFVVTIDNRYSPEEERGRGWIMPKTRERWRDTVLAWRRVEPPHVTRMHPYEMGQITQAWGVLEASAEPVEESWFVGRDIGAVGYYTQVRVYDTAGLFTPTVSHSADWTDHRVVTDELVRHMMGLRPLGGEIYEGWETALGRHPELFRGYRLRWGSAEAPYAFIADDRPRPSHEEVVRRYRAMVARFPRLYHLHTLYGESVGAAVERRLRIVETGAP